jgi:hypothetical protein
MILKNWFEKQIFDCSLYARSANNAGWCQHIIVYATFLGGKYLSRNILSAYFSSWASEKFETV